MKKPSGKKRQGLHHQVTVKEQRVAQKLDEDNMQSLIADPDRQSRQQYAQERGKPGDQQLDPAERKVFAYGKIDILHSLYYINDFMKRPPLKFNRFHMSGIILSLAALISLGLAGLARRSSEPGSPDRPATAEDWLARAEIMRRAHNSEGAEHACRVALAQHPWHSGAARTLTLVLLERGDMETLIDWMDDLVLGDARLAERFFLMPEFAPYLNDAAMQALFREAQIQARD